MHNRNLRDTHLVRVAVKAKMLQNSYSMNSSYKPNHMFRLCIRAWVWCGVE